MTGITYAQLHALASNSFNHTDAWCPMTCKLHMMIYAKALEQMVRGIEVILIVQCKGSSSSM